MSVSEPCIVNGTKRNPEITHLRFATCAAIVALVLATVPAAHAQCSQASRPAAVSAQPALPAPITPTNNPAADSSSSSAPSPNVRFVTGSAITVLEDTPLQVINDMPISSRTARPRAEIAFTVTQDVVVGDVLVIPCGARVYGTVVSVRQAGRLAGASNLTLQLTALTLGGKSYPLYTIPFKVVGQSKTPPTIRKVSAGAAVGTLAMDARVAQLNPHLTEPVTGGKRVFADTVGAGLGAGVGAAIAASSPTSIAVIPAESQIVFPLASPIAVYPVDQPTAARLGRGLHPGGPVLYVRGESQ